MEERRSEVAVSVINFDTTCRTCLCDLKEKVAFNLDDLLVQKHEGTTENTEMFAISEVLSKCTSIQVDTEDALPKNLCKQCVTELTFVYEFIKKCQKSEETLQTTLLKSNENIIVIKTDESDDLSSETENNIVKEPDTKPVIKKRMVTKKQLTTSDRNCCGLVFKNVDEYNEHRKTIKHTKPRIHECPHCPKKFNRRNMLTDHIRTHTKERPYSCDLCPLKFNNKCNLRRHGLVHSGEKRYNCEFCSKAFSKKYALQVHIRTHTGEKPYRCDHCGKCFKVPGVLKSHIQTFHDSAKGTEGPKLRSLQYECSICKRHLSSKQALKFHEERAHNDQRFLCSECGGRYASKHSLEIHYRVHTNEKPFVCDTCGKCFKQQSALRTHTYIHTGETPYSCEVCDQKFKQSTHLKVHQRVQHKKERPYVCKFCGNSFGMRSVLKVHERIHTGERPYKCDLCEKGFYDASSRKRHIATHVKAGEEVKEENSD